MEIVPINSYYEDDPSSMKIVQKPTPEYASENLDNMMNLNVQSLMLIANGYFRWQGGQESPWQRSQILNPQVVVADHVLNVA